MNRFNIHQTPEEIIKSSPPEIRIAWDRMLLICGERISISQIYFHGPVAGTEFLTYAAGKLYFIFDMTYASSLGAVSVSVPVVTVYNEANVIVNYLVSGNAVWDATAAAMRFHAQTGRENNFYFSRIAVTIYTHIRIVGFKISY